MRNQAVTFHTTIPNSMLGHSLPDGRADFDLSKLPEIITAVANAPLAFKTIAINWHFCPTSNQALDRDTDIGDFRGFEFNFDNELTVPKSDLVETRKSLHYLASRGAVKRLGDEHFMLTKIGGAAIKKCLPQIPGAQSLSFIGSTYKDNLLEPERFDELRRFCKLMKDLILQRGEIEAAGKKVAPVSA